MRPTIHDTTIAVLCEKTLARQEAIHILRRGDAWYVSDGKMLLQVATTNRFLVNVRAKLSNETLVGFDNGMCLRLRDGTEYLYPNNPLLSYFRLPTELVTLERTVWHVRGPGDRTWIGALNRPGEEPVFLPEKYLAALRGDFVFRQALRSRNEPVYILSGQTPYGVIMPIGAAGFSIRPFPTAPDVHRFTATEVVSAAASPRGG